MSDRMVIRGADNKDKYLVDEHNEVFNLQNIEEVDALNKYHDFLREGHTPAEARELAWPETKEKD